MPVRPALCLQKLSAICVVAEPRNACTEADCIQEELFRACTQLNQYSSLQGEWYRDYAPMGQREPQEDQIGDKPGLIPPSNAYKRRVAGTNWQ